ncbi:MAG: hypothetical protein AB7T86_12315 [Xanthobacteraceae bacterium]|uniref:hypothetical protein n=1 Tax=Pseudolabrys sp. TaxID=1960880 RepID=UPI003D10D66E
MTSPQDNPGAYATIKFTKEEGDAFFALVGRIIFEWASIDRDMFDLFHLLLGGDEKVASVVYYRHKTIGNKRDLAKDVAEVKLPDDDKARLKPIWDRIESNLWVRNAVAHYPTQVQFEVIWDLHADGGPKVIKNDAQIQAITEPKDVLSGAKEKTLKTQDLIDHLEVAKAIHKDFSDAVKIFQHNSSQWLTKFAQPTAGGSRQTPPAQEPNESGPR